MPCLLLSHVLTLWDPMDCSSSGSSLYGIFQSRILESVAISYSRGSSQPRDQIHVSDMSCIGTVPPGRPMHNIYMELTVLTLLDWFLLLSTLWNSSMFVVWWCVYNTLLLPLLLYGYAIIWLSQSHVDEHVGFHFSTITCKIAVRYTYCVDIMLSFLLESVLRNGMDESCGSCILFKNKCTVSCFFVCVFFF